MKELSIEEKAKAYDNLIERLKDFQSKYRFKTIEESFPELKENEDSKDERIRKALIKSFEIHDLKALIIPGFSAKDVIAWLEKQNSNVDNTNKEYWRGYCEGKQEILDKYAEPVESEDEQIRKGLIQYFSTFTLDTFAGLEPKKILSWLDKQGEQNHANKIVPKFKVGCEIKTANEEPLTITKIDEKGYWSEDLFICEFDDTAKWELVEQKHTDKVEPKFNFKVGQWIVATGKCVYLIAKIDGFNVTLVDINGDEYMFDVSSLDDAHEWTIQDAKDCDVLVNWNNTIYLFKGIEEEVVKFYCYYNTNCEEFNTPLDNNSHLGLTEPQFEHHPATKEQRDTLMKAMADAGYTFDFEKKELKKIVAPIFNIGDIIIKKHNSDIHDFGSFLITDIKDGKYWYNDGIICNITEQNEWELVEQKPAWSKEDISKIDRLIMYFKGKQPNKWQCAG